MACGFRSTSRPRRARPSAAWPATIPAAAARCATAPCATTSLDRGDAGRRHAGAFRPASAAISTTCRAPLRPLAKDLLAIGAREADEVAARFPKVQRRVGGYNLDALVPGKNDINLAHVLVGAEGTLGFSTRIELKLVAAARPPRGRRLPFRQFPRGDGCRAAHRALVADRGRIDRPHHDRACPRDPDFPADAGQIRARRRRTPSCWSSSARTTTRKTCAGCASSRI